MLLFLPLNCLEAVLAYMFPCKSQFCVCFLWIRSECTHTQIRMSCYFSSQDTQRIESMLAVLLALPVFSRAIYIIAAFLIKVHKLKV